MAIPTFVDQVTLHLAAGRGGNGVAPVKREKFKPLGGPDGGNGGQGGSIILQVDTSVTTLVDYHHSPKRRADNGGQGAGDHKNGGNGKDLVLTVPDGTLVKAEDGTALADLVGNGTTLVIAAGRRDLASAAQDRRLPVHHPHPQPRRGHRRRDDLRGRRRARPDRGCRRGPWPRPRLPAPHRALRRTGPRRRHGLHRA